MHPKEQKEEHRTTQRNESAKNSVNNNETQIIVIDDQVVQGGENEAKDAPSEQQGRQQFCSRCGKVGHIGNDCPNPIVYSRCNKEGHVARVCMSKMPWEYISPFCGLSAYGQAFHVIESANADDGIKDMSTTTPVIITSSQATARDVENEFRMKAGPNSTWRWYAKRLGEGKYQMRFPNAQTIDDLAHFTELRMRSNPKVVCKVEKWNPAIGSKGTLDVAWFRITNIPPEK